MEMKPVQARAHGLEVKPVADKPEVLFDLGVAGVVPINEVGAGDVAKEKLAIGLDWKLFKPLTIFDAKFDAAGFCLGQDFLECIFYSLESGLLFCIALFGIFGAEFFVFGSFLFAASCEVEEFIGVVLHVNGA